MPEQVALRPIVQEITSDELQRSGSVKKELTPSEEARVKRFLNAHAFTNADSADSTEANINDKNAKSMLDGKPQVTAQEQASTYAAKGLDNDLTKKPVASKNKQLYRLLFTSDPSFLEKDILSLKKSIQTKGKCLVDIAVNLNPKEKALRKYLLATLALEKDDLSKTEIHELNLYKKSIMIEHSEFIVGTISAFEVGKLSKRDVVTLKEFVKAYQTFEIEPQSDLFSLFNKIKKNISQDDFIQKIVKMREDYIHVLSREKMRSPTKATTPRHYGILSTLNQFNVLLKTHIIHKLFLDCCGKANLRGLPSLVNFLEAFLQTIATAEVSAGINNLIRIASAVTADGKTPGKNIFITNYINGVLNNMQYKNLYKTSSHQKIVSETLLRNAKAGRILSIRVSGSAGENK